MVTCMDYECPTCAGQDPDCQTCAGTGIARLPIGTIVKEKGEIFLDMDGVLSWSHLQTLWFYGIEITLETWPAGQTTLEIAQAAGATNITDIDVWWDHFDEYFWATLPKTPECDDLISSCARRVGEKNVFILSRPTNNPHCSSGKMIWVHQNLPTWIHDQVILTKYKWLLAGPDRFLIDDDASNCRAFRRQGGRAKWISRPWSDANRESLLK